MKKLLKLLVGIIAGLILLLYLIMPFVKVGEESFNFLGYINHIFSNINGALKNGEFTQVQMLHTVIAWLLILVVVCVPILCLIAIGIKGILSGIFTNRKLKVISVEALSFVFSGFLISFSYYLVYKYTLPTEANQLQMELVKIACSNIWQPLLYISAFGSLFLVGLNMFANSIKKKEVEE